MTGDAPALDRLRRRAEFVSAARDGVKVGGPLIGLQLNDRGDAEGSPRFGVTVTKRVGGSVERSRMKRRLRAAAREALGPAARPGCDYVLIARRAVLGASFARLLRDLRDQAKRAHGRLPPSGAPETQPAPSPGARESGR